MEVVVVKEGMEVHKKGADMIDALIGEEVAVAME